MIHSYVIEGGSKATAFLQAGKEKRRFDESKPFRAQTADAVVDVQAFLGRRVPGEATLSWAGRTPTPDCRQASFCKPLWTNHSPDYSGEETVEI